MFNTLFLILLGVLTVFESYKCSIQSNFKTLMLQKTNKSDNYLFGYLLIVILLFGKILNPSYHQQSLLMFLVIFAFWFNFFINSVYSSNISVVIIIALISYIIFQDTTVVSIIFGSELVSVLSFFIIFFNTKSFNKLLNTGIFYFLINNIITFLFGVTIVIFLLNSYGTLNYNALRFYFLETTNFNFVFILFIYFLFKLGQNFVIFFKFKFYKFAKFTHLVYYIIIYVIFI